MKRRHKIRAELSRKLGLQRHLDFGFPDRLIHSVADYVNDVPGNALQNIRPAYEKSFPEPIVDDPGIKKLLQDNQHVCFPDFQIATLHNMHLRSKHMFLLTPEKDAVLLESYISQERFMPTISQDALKRYKVIEKKGAYFLGFDRWGYNYYFHWMVETLSRFLALDHLPDDLPIIMPRKTQAYMRRSMELMGINEERLLYFDDQDWQLETCYFATKPYAWFVPSDKEVMAVRKRILSRLEANRDMGKRIYISRAKCKNRVLANESAVQRILEDKGFTTVFPEEYTLDEQISIFQHAEVMVGSFGSGMTNIMFCDPDTPVLLFYDNSFYDPCIWALGNCVDLKMSGISYTPDGDLDLEKLANAVDALLS